MYKSGGNKRTWLIAMATAWVAFAPTTQAASSPEISYDGGQSIFSGLFDTVTITPTGSFISSSGTALSFQSVTMGTLNNNGTIQSAGVSANDAGMNIDTASTVDSFNNAGLIAGNTIVSSNTYGLYNRGIIGTLENSDNGIIEGFAAINNNRTITSLINQGTIRGTNTGILNWGTITHWTNNGLIDSDYAINNPGTLTNGITNNGTIRGTDAAIYNSGIMPVINNNGKLLGNIWNNTATVLTINGGSSYDSLISGYSGGGTVYSSAADVHFGTGKLTVDDNFQMGAQTVVNEGASLLLNRTVTITGNYIQQAQGVLVIGVADGALANGSASDSGYGRLVVTGDATLAPSSNVSLLTTGSSYGFASGQRFLVVQASGAGTQYNESDLTYQVSGYSGGISGKTAVVDGVKSLVVYLDAPEGNTPEGNTPGGNTPTVPNAISSLSGLGNYSGFSAGLLDLFNASKAIGSRDEANRAGEQLSPVQNAAASSVASAASSAALRVVSNRMNSVRFVPNRSMQRGMASGDGVQEWAVWGQPFYGNAQQGMIDSVSGYKAHYGGVVLGADRQVADNWRAGGAFSYASSSVNGRDNLTGSHTDVDAWSGIVYAGWSGRSLYANLTASVSTQKYESQRRIAFGGFSGEADGSFNGQQIMAKAEAGYPIVFAQDITLTSLAAISYGYMHQDAYKEHSDQGAAILPIVSLCAAHWVQS